jgi:hypothetical protein
VVAACCDGDRTTVVLCNDDGRTAPDYEEAQGHRWDAGFFDLLSSRFDYREVGPGYMRRVSSLPPSGLHQTALESSTVPLTHQAPPTPEASGAVTDPRVPQVDAGPGFRLIVAKLKAPSDAPVG